MASELTELRARSSEYARHLDHEEAIEANLGILDLDPGDPVATNRLGIGLLKVGRPADALAVLENGLRVHPDNSIMRARATEARKALSASPAHRITVTRGAHGRREPVIGGWTDFEPAELVERCLEGPGRDACIGVCAASIRMSEAIDERRTAVTPIKQGRRFRTIGGIFTGVAPWRETLTVAVPVARRALISQVIEAGGFSFEPPKAVPCLQLAIPQDLVESFLDRLLEAHREHLKLSLEAGPPTHLNKHHPDLRRYLLEQADRL